MSALKTVSLQRLALLLTTTLFTAASVQGASAPILSPELPVSGDLTGALAANTKETPAVTATDAAGASALTMPGTPSRNVTINLINRLVQRGVLPKEDASELIKQAEADTALANAQASAIQMTVAQVAAAQAAAPPANDYGSSPEDALRVTYIPDSVKRQLREELREDVMAKARRENWAAPNTFPNWISRIKLFGDVRVRYDGAFFSNGNDVDAYPNFNAINTGSPYDISGTVLPPQLNVDQERNRLRLRARFGIEADLGDGFSAGIRIATGENNSPVTTNQSFGLANQGQGGNFSKYAIWLDRGFLKYEIGGLPTKNLTFLAGRFDNPFFNSEVMWDDDLGFDGLAIAAKYELHKGITPFVTVGAFPVFNTDFNFSSIQAAKFKSTDKWLYGGQIGTDWRINKDFNFKLAAAYYYFDDVAGKLSDPFTPLTAQDNGNTDNTRPSFAQKGNSYMALRQIIPSALNNFGTTNQYQYFGLATPFHDLAITGKLDYSGFDPFHITLSGEYIKNLAFSSGAASAISVNNRASVVTGAPAGTVGAFAGGDTAWIVGLKVGSAALEKRWDWNVGLNYRYVESDAVVDGLTDSDFGLGGTNLRGYTLSGTVALSPRVNVGLRWMSAREVGGPPFKVDVLQFDFSGKF